MNLSRKQLTYVLLFVVVAVGFFLRSYNFSDWLHFELDQSRDARVIDRALENGPADLPLLGPKAGGTFLRLAPGFYYLEYVSALIFGGSPAGMAAFVLVFSVLSLPIFYLLVRRYFSQWVSLSLTFLFSVSEFFVMYGRFAWNPNLIPFFMLLGVYSMLRAVDETEIRRGRWFLISVASFTLATHFHFLVFLAVPVIAGSFLLVMRPHFSWKTWLGALGIVGLLYLPMALNEIETKGANTREFFGAITEKSSKEDHSLAEKAIRDVAEHVLHGLVITTGFEAGTLPSFKVDGGLTWACQGRCDEGKWYGVAAALVFFAGLGLFAWQFIKETERKKRDFLLLTGLWFSVAFVLFLPLAYGVAPRFFLLSGIFFFILLGMIFSFIERLGNGGNIAKSVILIVVIALSYLNLASLGERLGEMSRADRVAVKSAPDRILKERIRVTLKQQNMIVDMFEQRSKETGYPVYMFSEPQHRRALKYLMERRGIENAVLGFDGVYKQGVYYLVLRAQSDVEDALKKYRVNYTVGETTSFGTLVSIELFPKPEAIIGERQDFSIVKPSDSKAPPRYTWREFFERKTGSSNVFDESALDQVEESEATQ